jgi:hypothetical protein
MRSLFPTDGHGIGQPGARSSSKGAELRALMGGMSLAELVPST